MSMDKEQSDDICNRALACKGGRIKLHDGRAGKIVNASAEAGSVWLLPDGENQHDIRVWASAVAEVSAPAGLPITSQDTP